MIFFFLWLIYFKAERKKRGVDSNSLIKCYLFYFYLIYSNKPGEAALQNFINLILIWVTPNSK